MTQYKNVSIKEIAAELHLSINTISRALRDCSDISEGTKKRVRKKAIEMGYIPNTISLFLDNNNVKKTIAIVVNSLKNLYFSLVIDKLTKVFNEMGYSIMVVPSYSSFMSKDIFSQCLSLRANGIISFNDPTEEALSFAKVYKIPLVVVGREISTNDADIVYQDDERGGALAADYLLSKGLNKFIYAKLKSVECSARRYKGFYQEIVKKNRQAKIKLIDTNDIEHEIINLIDSDYNGIFCFSDEYANKIIDFINSMEVWKDKKIYVVGFDAIDLYFKSTNKFPSISYDLDAILKTSAEMISRRLKDPNIGHQSQKFPVSLYIPEKLKND